MGIVGVACFAASVADQIDPLANQVGGEIHHLLVLARSPAVLDRKILALDIAALSHHLNKGLSGSPWTGIGREPADSPNTRGLMSARRNRQGRRAAEQRDEVAAFIKKLTGH